MPGLDLVGASTVGRPCLMALPHRSSHPDAVAASPLVLYAALGAALQFGALGITSLISGELFHPKKEGSLSDVDFHLCLNQVADWVADLLATVASASPTVRHSQERQSGQTLHLTNLATALDKDFAKLSLLHYL